MSKIKCELCGEKTGRVGDKKRTFMSQFPLNADRCRKWVKLTGNEDLVYVPIEKLHQLKYICGKHFLPKDFSKKKTQLRKTAIPSLHIKATPLPDKLLVDFPLHIHRSNQETKLPAETVEVKLEDPLLLPSEIFEHETRSNSPIELSTPTCHNGPQHLKRTSPSPVPTTSTLDPKKRKLDSPTPTKPKERSPSPVIPSHTRKLMKKLKACRIQLRQLRRKVAQIDKISSPVMKSFIESSVANLNRKPKGKRWTDLNKTVALAIYQNSRKAFTYLAQLLPMPSVRTIQIIIEHIKIDTGIEATSISYLKKKTESLTEKEKICVLLFDEIPLKQNVGYNVFMDRIDGYEDLGDNRSVEIADHALVFMLQGMRKSVKQPVAHYFVKGSLDAGKLAVLIVDVIRAVTNAGYEVIATVCDQERANMGALNLLCTWGNSEEPHYFVLDEKKVFIIYDVPSLYKSIRDNFMQGGEIILGNKKAKWDHLVKLEQKNQTTLHIKTLTKTHLIPKWKSKMKVKFAAQLLSNTVSAFLKLQADCVENEESEEILETAQIIEELDQLFDCTNGPASRADIKRNVRENVSRTSFHHKKWIHYQEILQTLNFLVSDNQLRMDNLRCVTGYLITLSSLQDVWSYLNSKNFKIMNLRQLNMDALDNLFGVVEILCPTNKNTTCQQFSSAFKSAIITRLCAPVRGDDCESANNDMLIDFQEIVFPKKKEQALQLDIVIDNSTSDVLKDSNEHVAVLHMSEVTELQKDLAEIDRVFKRFDKEPTVYISGYLASVIIKGDCMQCVNALKVSEPIPHKLYNYTALKEWWKDKNSLTYPSLQLCEAVDEATRVFEEKITPNIFAINVCTYSKIEMLANVDVSWMCKEHRNATANKLFQRLSLLFIRNHCHFVNKWYTLSEKAPKKVQIVSKKGKKKAVA